MKKELSVVFPIYEQAGKTYILMGRQAPGKKLAGFRNGYGGKCEEGESTLSCAKRELEEELHLDENYGVNISYAEFEKIGKILMDEKRIDIFVIRLPTKISEPADNGEFVDTKWFDLENPKTFVGDMLSGDEVLVENLIKYLEVKKEGGVWQEFEINKTGNRELEKQVKNIYK